MLNEVDDDGSGGIEFPEFLKVIDSQKAKLASDHDESDMIDAFVAMGGGADRSGNVEAEKLRRTIKAFELTIDIERLIKEVVCSSFFVHLKSWLLIILLLIRRIWMDPGT